MTAGALIYRLWHQPVGAIQKSIAAGGPIEQWRTSSGMTQMKNVASRLPSLPTPGETSPAIHFLTGSRFWFQTAFCITSWQKKSGITPIAHLHDDGTLEGHQIEKLLSLLPGARVYHIEETKQMLDTHLPVSRFPYLRELWDTYPNIRKLTDIHLGHTGWKLVLDSDMLFFQSPNLLTHWCKNPSQPLHSIDSEESYGYPRSTMELLCGETLPKKVNVGICGLNSSDIDWEQLEQWCQSLIQKHGKHYFLEQALVAMLIAGKNSLIAPKEDYITFPQLPEAEECTAVMHHYVADSKKYYFRNNWKIFAPSSHAT